MTVVMSVMLQQAEVSGGKGDARYSGALQECEVFPT